MKLLLFCLVSITSLFSFAVNDSTLNNFSISAGSNGSWWKYQRGTAQGWDRSDFVGYYNMDLAYYRSIKSYQLGITASYGVMDEQYIEAYNDIPGKRVKLNVSNTYIQFVCIGGEIMRELVSSPKYKLLVGVGAGTFQIETTYSNRSNFGNKIYWNASVKQQILLKNNYFLSIKMVYEKKHIFVPEGIDNEHHEIFKSGVQLGIEKYF